MQLWRRFSVKCNCNVRSAAPSVRALRKRYGSENPNSVAAISLSERSDRLKSRAAPTSLRRRWSIREQQRCGFKRTVAHEHLRVEPSRYIADQHHGTPPQCKAKIPRSRVNRNMTQRESQDSAKSRGRLGRRNLCTCMNRRDGERECECDDPPRTMWKETDRLRTLTSKRTPESQMRPRKRLSLERVDPGHKRSREVAHGIRPVQPRARIAASIAWNSLRGCLYVVPFVSI